MTKVAAFLLLATGCRCGPTDQMDFERSLSQEEYLDLLDSRELLTEDGCYDVCVPPLTHVDARVACAADPVLVDVGEDVTVRCTIRGFYECY